MFEAHFRLETKPFSHVAAQGFVYQSRELKEASVHFQYALENADAMLLLTGEVGTGKTTAIQSLVQLLPEDSSVALLSHSTFTPREMLQEIAMSFGVETAKRETKPMLIRKMEKHLKALRSDGRQLLVIVDEAHLLSIAALQELRLLSNLRFEETQLIQIWLVGQPELLEQLRKPKLRSLRQRISIRYELKPLRRDDTENYLIHRLRAAGCEQAQKVFSPKALDAVQEISHGIPREINVVAGQAMLNAFIDDDHVVKQRHVVSVKSNYGFEGLETKLPRSIEPEKEAPNHSPPPAAVPRKVRAAPRQRPSVPALAAESTPTCDIEPSSGEGQPVSIGPSQAESAPAGEPEVIGASYGTVSHDRMEDGAQILLPTASADEDVQSKGLVTAETDAVFVDEPSPSVSKPLRILMDSGPDRDAAEVGVAWMPFALSIKKVLRLFGALAVSALAVTWLISARSPISRPEIDEAREHPRSEQGVGAVSADEDVNPDRDATEPVTPQSNETAGQPRTEFPVAASTASPAPVILDKRVIERDFEGSITVQIASLLSRESADRVLAEAEARTGLKGVVYPPMGQESQWYVIYLGSFTSVEMAEEAVQPLFVEQLITEVLVKPVPRGFELQLAGELE